MTRVFLFPDAHGTLNALRNLKAITHYEEASADELVAVGLARRQGNELHITDEGLIAEALLRIHTRASCRGYGSSASLSGNGPTSRILMMDALTAVKELEMP